MQVDKRELPLALRRSQQEIKYSVKVKSTDGHPAKSVTDFHWTTLGENFKPVLLQYTAKPYSIFRKLITN